MLPQILGTEKEVVGKDLGQVQELLEGDFNMSFHSTSLEALDIKEDGTISADGKEYVYTPLFMESLAGWIGMPLCYAHKIDFSLFKENFDRRKQKNCSGIKICISRGMAVNICPENYSPARTRDLIRGLPENLVGKDFHEAVLGDRGIELSWVDKGICINPRPGDVILAGVRISNSESGFRAPKASVFTLRLACSNGSVFAEESHVIRWRSDRRVTYASNIEKFCNELKFLEIPRNELSERYSRTLDQAMTDQEVVNLWRRVRRVMAPSQADRVFQLPIEARQALFARMRQRDEPKFLESPEFSRYEIHNRITEAAKEFNVLVRRHLEEIGGEVLWPSAAN